MPQLTPDPWFLILLVSWLVIIFLPAQKILKYSIPNNLTTKTTKHHHTNWSWPWL
uniref:ATP synthase complex subunit 8 n=1 Tax=Otophryne sp. MZUSP 159214 TaxID=2877826 RepID=A0A8K1HA22_9NEOB|nr:ATP synthase F0 subunit 8 [Otophryne sp. MZUSP 159214]